jgi:hypothetical protein
LGSPSRLGMRSRLLNLGYVSTCSKRWKNMTYQVIMGLGVVILSGDEQSLIKLPMSDWAIAKVLLGICVWVLLVSVDWDESGLTYVGGVSGVGFVT